MLIALHAEQHCLKVLAAFSMNRNIDAEGSLIWGLSNKVFKRTFSAYPPRKAFVITKPYEMVGDVGYRPFAVCELLSFCSRNPSEIAIIKTEWI